MTPAAGVGHYYSLWSAPDRPDGDQITVQISSYADLGRIRVALGMLQATS